MKNHNVIKWFGLLKTTTDERVIGEHIYIFKKHYFCGFRYRQELISRPMGIADKILNAWGQGANE